MNIQRIKIKKRSEQHLYVHMTAGIMLAVFAGTRQSSTDLSNGKLKQL